METCTAVSKRVRELLDRHSMNQYRLEKLTGIPHSTMQSIIHNKSKTVTLATVMRIARGFNMSVSDFLNDKVFLDIKVPYYDDGVSNKFDQLFTDCKSVSGARYVYLTNREGKNASDSEELFEAYNKALKLLGDRERSQSNNIID